MDYEVKFSKEEIAKYIEIFMGSRDLQKYLNTQSTDVIGDCDMIVHSLVTYTISSGDKGTSRQLQMIPEFIKKIQKLKLDQSLAQKHKAEFKKELFAQVALPILTSYVKAVIGLKHEKMTCVTMNKIVNTINNQNCLNRFKTHSFNGALYDRINNNGLDISQELFTEEFADFSKISKSGFKTGKLCFCELSAETFGYSHNMPERLYMTLSTPHVKKMETETTNSYLKRGLEYLLETSNEYSEQQKEKFRVSITKLIDFYTSTPEVCIAVADNGGFKRNKTESLSLAVDYYFKKSLGEYGDEVFNVANSNDPDRFEKLDAIFDKARDGNLELSNKIFAFKSKEFARGMFSNFNNFMHAGYVDGHEIEGGKLSRSEFAIAKYADPYQVATNYKIKLARQNAEAGIK